MLYIAGFLAFVGFGFLILSWIMENDTFKLNTWGRVMLIAAALLIGYNYYKANQSTATAEETEIVSED